MVKREPIQPSVGNSTLEFKLSPELVANSLDPAAFSLDASKPDSNPEPVADPEVKANKPEAQGSSHLGLRVKVGTAEYSTHRGQVLSGSYVWLHTNRVSEAVILLDDPDGAILATLENSAPVEVETGFLGGTKRQKFVGVVQRFGRRGNDTTIVQAVDQAAKLGQQQGTGVASSKAATPDAKQDSRASSLNVEEFRAALDAIERLMQASRDQPGVAAVLAQVGKMRTLVNSSKPGEAGSEVAALQALAGELDPTQVPAVGSSLPELLADLRAAIAKPVATQSASPGFDEMMDQVTRLLQATATPEQPKTSTAERVAVSSLNLLFADNSATQPTESGRATPQKSDMANAVAQAAEQGNVLVVSGNTLTVSKPGGGGESGLKLDYRAGKPVFTSPPQVLKKSPGAYSGYGAILVQGYNIDSKSTISAAVAVPGGSTVHPTGVVNVPEWGAIKLADPIQPGSLYTWADATLNGERVPESQAVMKGIALAAQILDELSKKYLNGSKFTINSWYRPPAVNVAVSSSGPSGPHTTGSAVDFKSANMDQVHADLKGSWEGGVAISPGSFVHVDWIGHPEGIPGTPRRRWSY